MNILSIFGRGVRLANKSTRICLYLWLANLVFSALILAPVYFALAGDLSRSLGGDRLIGGFDLLVLGDLIYKYQSLLPSALGWLLVTSLVYFGLMIFLDGGMIGTILARESQEGKTNLALFFEDCGKYFFRFLRVFLISLVAFALVLGIFYRTVAGLFNLWTKSASTEWPSIFSSNLKTIIFILLFSIVRMFFDYVKLGLAAGNSSQTLRATLSTFSFLGRRFFRAWFLYIWVAVFYLLVTLGMLLLGKLLPERTPALLFVIFVGQQIFILFRMWTRVLFVSTEFHFLRAAKEP